MSGMGHSRLRRGTRCMHVLPQCPESGRKVRALLSVAMGQLQTHAAQQSRSTGCSPCETLLLQTWSSEWADLQPVGAAQSSAKLFAAFLTRDKKCRTTAEGSPWRETRFRGAVSLAPSLS